MKITTMFWLILAFALVGCSTKSHLETAGLGTELIGKGPVALKEVFPNVFLAPKSEYYDCVRYRVSLPNNPMFRYTDYHLEDGEIDSLMLRIREGTQKDILLALTEKYGEPSKDFSFPEWRGPQLRIQLHEDIKFVMVDDYERAP